MLASSSMAESAIFDRMWNTSTLLTGSTTAPGSSEVYRGALEVTLGTITFLVIIFMTLFGNMLVIMSVFTYRPLMKVQNYFMVSLAAADFTVASFVMPFHLVKFLAAGKWIFGLILCQLWLTLDILCCTSSILNLTAIAIDRYWAIHDPINYAQRRTLGLVGGMIFGVWSLSALISIPPLIGWNDWTTSDLLDKCELSTNKGFVLYSASGSFYVPLVIMTVTYAKIFVAARARIRKNKKQSAIQGLGNRLKKARAGKSAASAPSAVVDATVEKTQQEVDDGRADTESTVVEKSPLFSTASGPGGRVRAWLALRRNKATNGQFTQVRHVVQSGGDQNNHDVNQPQQQATGAANGAGANTGVAAAVRQREKISVAKEKKAAKTLAVIMGVFVLCWLPFFLMYIIMPYCESCYMHEKVVEAIVWLGYINSAINPVIYTIFNLDFRRAFEKILCPNRSRARFHSQTV